MQNVNNNNNVDGGKKLVGLPIIVSNCVFDSEKGNKKIVENEELVLNEHSSKKLEKYDDDPMFQFGTSSIVAGK